MPYLPGSALPQPTACLVQRLLDLPLPPVRREREARRYILGLLDPQVVRYGRVARSERARELLQARPVCRLRRVNPSRGRASRRHRGACAGRTCMTTCRHTQYRERNERQARVCIGVCSRARGRTLRMCSKSARYACVSARSRVSCSTCARAFVVRPLSKERQHNTVGDRTYRGRSVRHLRHERADAPALCLSVQPLNQFQTNPKSTRWDVRRADRAGR